MITKFTLTFLMIVMCVGCGSIGGVRGRLIRLRRTAEQPAVEHFSGRGQAVAVPAPKVFVVGKSVKLIWVPSPSPGEVGYKVYYGLATRDYDYSVDVGHTIGCELNLAGGAPYYFAVTAYDEDGSNESLFSEETAYWVPLSLDLEFDFGQPVSNVTVQASGDMFYWTDYQASPTNGMWRINVDQGVNAGFFRAVGQPVF